MCFDVSASFKSPSFVAPLAPRGWARRDDANRVHASRSEWRERRRSNVVHADDSVDWLIADGWVLLGGCDVAASGRGS